MNRWLTWRARLAHFLDPRTECLCHVCAQARFRMTAERLGNAVLAAARENTLELEKCRKI